MTQPDSIFGAELDCLKRLLTVGEEEYDQDSTEHTPETVTLHILTERPGGQIGRYKLLSVLGEGGMGVVYLAQQEQPITREVALKVIKPGMDSKRVIARFEAERQALALLDHPGIAHVYDAGTTETGRPYFVMEHVNGIPITEHCDRYKLTITERLELFLQVCEAVQHAHQKGIIHRDIKPSNVQIAIQGEQTIPKIIDFGVAKAISQPLTEHTLVTEQGQFVGTPEYMSPEQADLGSEDIDTRSDVYSLGVLLYELLTGVLPFDPQTLREGGIDRIRHIIREAEPKTPSTRLSTISGKESTKLAQLRRTDVRTLGRLLHGDLDWITLKTMEKDRTRRYQTAHALTEDIQRYMNQEPVLAGPPSMVYRARKFVMRNKSLVSSLTAIVIILMLATAVSIQQRNRAEEQELKARQRAYSSDMNLLVQALAVNDMGRALALLNRHRPSSTNPMDLRGWEWRYLWQQCQSNAQMFCQTKDYVNSLSVSHDGKWLAVGNGGHYGEVSVWDMQTRQRIETLALKVGGVARAAFSPREPLLAFFCTTPNLDDLDSGLDYIRLWDLRTRQIVGELPLIGTCTALEFSSDGEYLIIATRKQITIWSVAESKKLDSYELNQEWMYIGKTLALACDMSLLVHTSLVEKKDQSWDKRIRVLDLSTGQERWSALAADENLSTLALSPDASILASNNAYYEDKIRLWDMASGKEVGRLEGHRGWISDLRFLPDNETLVSASDDQTIRIWDVSDPRHGKLASILRSHNGGVWRIVWLPDKKTLISGAEDGSVYFWDIEKRPKNTRPVTLSNIAVFCFPSQGGSVLTVNCSGRVIQYDGPEYSENRILFDLPESKYKYLKRLKFSNDGRKIAINSDEDTISVWNVPSGTQVRSLKCPESKPLGFLKQGRELATVSWSRNSTDIWEVSTGQHISSLPGAAKGSVISSDGRWCLTGATLEGKSTLRDLVNGDEQQFKLNITVSTGAAFSPDNKLFAASSRKGIVKLWERETMQEIIADLEFMVAAWSVAFSPDGNRLVAGGSGMESIKIWDVDSHQELLTLATKGTGCSRTAFSPDGDTLATINNRNMLHIWRAPSWEEIEKAEALSQQAEN